MNQAAVHQPPPAIGQQEVAPFVLKDIEDRVKMGYDKYGTKLKTFNGRSALWDAYQEAVDLVMYLRQEILERERQLHRIAFDLDDVIFNTAPKILELINKSGVPTPPFDMIHSFDLGQFCTTDREIITECVQLALESELPLLTQDTLFIFESLRKTYGYEIFVISHRKEELRETTLANLDKHKLGIDSDHLLLVEGYIPNTKIPNKVEFVKAYGFECVVDDRLDILESIREEIDNVFLFLFDRPWNRRYPLGNDYKRIYNIGDVLFVLSIM